MYFLTICRSGIFKIYRLSQCSASFSHLVSVGKVKIIASQCGENSVVQNVETMLRCTQGIDTERITYTGIKSNDRGLFSHSAD